MNMSGEEQPSTSASFNDGRNSPESRNSPSAANPVQESINHNICCRFSSVAWFAFFFTMAIIFLVVANVRADESAGLNVHGQLSIYGYLTVVHFFAIVWMIVSLLLPRCREKCRTNHIEQRLKLIPELIPERLLTGVMFFGLGSSFLSMIELIQYLDGHLTNSDCNISEDITMLTYYVVRTLFVYVQLYFFYKLSADPLRVKMLQFHGHFLFMHLIAVNLGTWIVTFVYDSIEELNEHSEEGSRAENETIHNSTISFMARHWGTVVKPNETACYETVEALESAAKKMEPYLYTFTMEYCLISAGLLLNAWGSLSNGAENTDQQSNNNTADDAGTSGSTPEVNTTLWRFCFVFGLVYIPAFVAIVLNLLYSDDREQDQIIYVVMEFIFFLSIFVASFIGYYPLKTTLSQTKTHGEVDVVLLGAALIGVAFLDMLIIFASICEWHKSPCFASCLIVTNIMELMSSIMFASFVQKAFKCSSVHGTKYDFAPTIREVVSFLFMLNICFWALYTFEVKKSNMILDIVEQFYSESVWFYLSHFAYPLAVFFHFHGAVCMVEILKQFDYPTPKPRTD